MVEIFVRVKSVPVVSDNVAQSMSSLPVTVKLIGADDDVAAERASVTVGGVVSGGVVVVVDGATVVVVVDGTTVVVAVVGGATVVGSVVVCGATVVVIDSKRVDAPPRSPNCIPLAATTVPPANTVKASAKVRKRKRNDSTKRR